MDVTHMTLRYIDFSAWPGSRTANKVSCSLAINQLFLICTEPLSLVLSSTLSTRLTFLTFVLKG